MTYDTADEESGTSTTDRGGSEFREGWDRSSPPSLAIVETIADATERDAEAVPPLHHFVDADALDTLLTRERQREAHVHISFTFDGALVSVGSDGDLSIRPDGTTHEPTTPETDADLETALVELLRLASRNGVSIPGGYRVQNGPDLPDWDIHITQVETPRKDDS